MSDAIQPRPQRDWPLVGSQRAVGAQKDVLEDVLGVCLRARQHWPGVGPEPGAVAVMDDREGVFVAGAELRQQLLVGSQSQQRALDRDTAQACWRWCG